MLREQQQQQQQQPNGLLAQATDTGFFNQTTSLFSCVVGQDTQRSRKSTSVKLQHLPHLPPKRKSSQRYGRENTIFQTTKRGGMPLSSLQKPFSQNSKRTFRAKGGRLPCTSQVHVILGFYFITCKPQTLSSNSSTEPKLRFLPANDQHLQRLAARFQVHDGMYGMPRWCGIFLPT